LDRRKRAKHSREPAALGAIRLRWHNGNRCRFIKVRMRGPKASRWMHYARWLWERNKGPVPSGMRVIHKDGDSLNDDPDNLEAATPGDVAFLWHERDPEGSVRNYEKCRAATAAFNRELSAIARATRYLDSRWYPVDHQERVIHNQPCRKRWQCFAAFGVEDATFEHRGIDAAALGWPGLPLMQVLILTALATAPDMSSGQLAHSVGDLRRLYGFGSDDPLRTTIFSAAGGLRRRDMILTLRIGGRKVYRATQSALKARKKPCPIVPVRGRELAGQEYIGFRKVNVEDLVDA
jgi:hypothetical protein